MYRFIVVAGRFVCAISVVTCYAASISCLVILWSALKICVNTYYHSTILDGSCLDGTFTLSLQGLQASIAFLPDSHGETNSTAGDPNQDSDTGTNSTAGATHQSATDSRVANPAIVMLSREAQATQNWSGFVQRLSLLDTGTDAYLRQTAQSMSYLVSSETKISTAGPLELEATHSGLLSMLLRDRDGNLHELLIERALVVPSLTQNLSSSTPGPCS